MLILGDSVYGVISVIVLWICPLGNFLGRGLAMGTSGFQLRIANLCV